MIVWLASYPRSGNTLLRTVLKQTMELDALPERTEWPRYLAQDTPRDLASNFYGELSPSEPWQSFYPRARESPELHLIKTHEAPFDDGPAIYVVRDGRKASLSYYHFHRAYLADLGRTLLQIVAGDDYYGDWTSRYHAWTTRAAGAPTLILRYEELHSATPELTQKIASFLKLGIVPAKWENPFEKIQQLNPHSFREGLKQWMKPVEWDDEIDWAFSLFHSPLMGKLGYPPDPPPPHRVEEENTMAANILDILESGLDQRRCIPRPLDERGRLREMLERKLGRRSS